VEKPPLWASFFGIAETSPQQRRNIGSEKGGNQGVALDHSGCVPEVVAYIGLDRLVSFKRYPEPMPFTYIDAFFTATLWPPGTHQGRTRDAPGIMQWCTLGRSNAAPNDACIRKHLFFFRVISPGILPFLVYRSFFFVLYRNYFLTYAGMHRYIQIIETTADTNRWPRHQGAAVGKQRSAPASKPTTAETPGRETDQLPERGSRLQLLE